MVDNCSQTINIIDTQKGIHIKFHITETLSKTKLTDMKPTYFCSEKNLFLYWYPRTDGGSTCPGPRWEISNHFLSDEMWYAFSESDNIFGLWSVWNGTTLTFTKNKTFSIL